MSDAVLKLIPTNPSFIPSIDAQRKAVEVLESLLPNAGPCEAKIFSRLEFIDQGENLSSITCPACKTHLNTASEDIRQWWHAVSEDADEKGYDAYKLQMPCCKRFAFFTDLTFDSPAGFARFILTIDGPQAVDRPLPAEILKTLSKIIGCGVIEISAYY